MMSDLDAEARLCTSSFPVGNGDELGAGGCPACG